MAKQETESIDMEVKTVLSGGYNWMNIAKELEAW